MPTIDLASGVKFERAKKGKKTGVGRIIVKIRSALKEAEYNERILCVLSVFVWKVWFHLETTTDYAVLC